MAGLGAAATAEAAERYRRAGAATMGAPDAIAGSLDFCEVCTRCQGGAQYAWASYEGGSECIAYYPTTGIDKARSVVLFFDGDVPGSYHFNETRMMGHLTTMRRYLELLSRTYGVPYAYVGRPGTFGSTGSHHKRRGMAEYQALAAAAIRIRERHGISRLALAGQSGGATAIGAMLALGLENVACAVPASGGFDLDGMIGWHAAKKGIDQGGRAARLLETAAFNVMHHLGGIPRDPSRRLFVLGDPKDAVTPFEFQRTFADRVREAGHHAVLLEGHGSGEEHHGLAGTALRLAGLCAAGRSDEAIRDAVQRGH
jgi:hypothetical protein